MNRSRIRLFFLLLLPTAALTSCPALVQRPPNVVLILTDDQGWGDLSANHNPWLRTPSLDQLAREGVSLENYYVSPLCAPSRASLLTGRYHLETGVVSVSKGLETMAGDETTLAELFKANGYRTGIFGKWHNGQHYPNRPNDQGFDEFLGFCAGHWSNYFDTQLEHNNQLVPTKGYISDVLTDAALGFIKASAEKPFFCYIPYNAPHSPFQVPDSYFNKFKTQGLDDELACVYGMVSNLDDNVGRVLAYLRDHHLADNTIVVFMSDNGPNGHRYNGVLRGIKGSVHEGGMRAPCFIRWPKQLPAGRVVATPAAHLDIYPTLLELCGLRPVPTKGPLNGVSLAPSLRKEGAAPNLDNRRIFAHVNFMEVPATLNAGGFRSSQYRFVYEQGRPQFYDLRQDPAEEHDLAAEQPALTSAFAQDYQRWFAQATRHLAYDRPIVLAEPGVTLPVYEATLSAGIKLKEGHSWAHDWAERWPTTSDSLVWNLDCQRPGRYRVSLEYLCEKANTGSVVACSLGKETQKTTIRQAFSSVQLPSPDRVLRKEAYEMAAWGQLPLGTFRVPAGPTLIRLRAARVVGTNVAQVNGLRIEFVDE